MKKVVISNKRYSREYKTNPHASEDLKKRLKKSNCLYYDTNTAIKDLGNGYSLVMKKENNNYK